jgi:hypothetical protein
MDRRLTGVLLLVTLLLAGCATSLREVRAQEPRYTRSGIGTPEGAAHCVQDYLEEHFGGFWGRLGGLIYEVRREDAATHLIGRAAMVPADVFFALSLTSAGSEQVHAQLRMENWRSWQVSAVIESIDACVRPPS